MSQNFLQLNENKSEIILSKVRTVSAPCLQISNQQPETWVVFFGQWTLLRQTSAFHSRFLQLRSFTKIRFFLARTDLEKVLHAFISWPPDYGNSPCSGLSQKPIPDLQLVQNAAARLLTNSERQEHISPVLASLHWLQVNFKKTRLPFLNTSHLRDRNPVRV